MNLDKIFTLTLSLTFIASQALAIDPVFYCDNSGNENNDWATVPGNAEGLANAQAACSAQGGRPVAHDPQKQYIYC